jgi:hypothetical protein
MLAHDLTLKTGPGFLWQGQLAHDLTLKPQGPIPDGEEECHFGVIVLYSIVRNMVLSCK